MFRFQRKKVAGRTDAEVVFPILPEMRVILNRQAENEERGGLVFGYLKDKIGRIDEREERRLCALLNSTIRARMRNVAKAVGLQIKSVLDYGRIDKRSEEEIPSKVVV